jgi:micrococcal nuclease
MRHLLNIFFSLSSAIAADSYLGHVTRVVDGDTLVVASPSGERTKVRLLGVDSPEKDQDGGTAATQFTRGAAAGQTVQVEEQYLDRDGRMVAEIVLPDGRLLTRALVAAGHAWWWPKYAPHDAALEQLEAAARERRLGLWAGNNPVAPWVWRKAQAAKRRAERQAARSAATAGARERHRTTGRAAGRRSSYRSGRRYHR